MNAIPSQTTLPPAYEPTKGQEEHYHDPIEGSNKGSKSTADGKGEGEEAESGNVPQLDSDMLQPQSPAIGLFDSYIREKEVGVDMVKQDRFIGFVDWSILDSTTRQPVLNSELSKGKWSSRKRISDLSENELFEIASKTISYAPTYIGKTTEEGSNEPKEIFRVRGSANCLSCNLKLTVSFVNASTSQPIELVLLADRQGNGALHLGDPGRRSKDIGSVPTLATVENYRDSDEKGYRLRVAPGVDIALVTASIMAMHGAKVQRQATGSAAVSSVVVT